MRGFFVQSAGNTPFQLPDDVVDDKCFSNSYLTAEDLNCGCISDIITQRECGLPGHWNSWCSSRLIPNKYYPRELSFDSWVYNGQFSSTGDMYYCSSQKQIQIFNTSDIYNWVLHQSINANGSHWTICDFDLSPDQKYLIFSTLDSNLQLVSIDSEDKEYSSLNGEDAGGQVSFSTSTANYGILCVRFSGQGNSVIAGTNQHSIENYDLVKRQNVSSIVRAHSDEVNSVNFVDIEKSDVIVSGSDEACIKVWDLRCINSNQSPQGVLIGHKEGVTYISPKLDGVHLISNSKDQTIKLWDIRKLTSQKNYIEYRQTHRYQSYFDYRWEPYPLRDYTKRLSADSSLLSFRGHSVIYTLYRCYFSPLFTTGQRFIYTGSSDGNVYIYDTLTGKTAAVLSPPSETLDPSRPPPSRDVSWHPFVPVICATSWRSTVHLYTHIGDE